jgi:hypothetical protein
MADVVDKALSEHYTRRLVLDNVRGEMGAQQATIRLILSGSLFEQLLRDCGKGGYIHHPVTSFTIIQSDEAPYFARQRAILANRGKQ